MSSRPRSSWADYDASLISQGGGLFARSLKQITLTPQMRELFAELGVREVQPMLRLDASETVTPEADAEPWLAELANALNA